jgi:hypothetical protein
MRPTTADGFDSLKSPAVGVGVLFTLVVLEASRFLKTIRPQCNHFILLISQLSMCLFRLLVRNLLLAVPCA